MIYVDSSVALAHLLAEGKRMPDELWDETLTSSSLLMYEVWNRIHARRLAHSHEAETHRILGRVIMIELSPNVLKRALQPLPYEPRTLDALHLASMDYVQNQGQGLELASFDERLLASARALGIAIYRA